MDLFAKVSMIDVKSFLIDKDISETLNVIQEGIDPHATKTDFDIAPICNAACAGITGSPCEIGKDLFKDVEMFESYDGKSSSTVMEAVDMTHTRGGAQYYKQLLATPTHSTNVLKQRNHAINQLASKHLDDLMPMLKDLKEHEHDVAWVYETSKEELSSLYDIVFFNTLITNPLNKNSKVLTAYNFYRIIVSPIIGIITPLSYVIIPYLVLRFYLKVKMPLSSFLKFSMQNMFSMNSLSSMLPKSLSSLGNLPVILTIFFYFQGIVNSVELAKAINKVSQIITNKINGFVTFIKAAKGVVDSCPPSILSPFFSDIPPHPVDLNTFERFTPCKYSIFTNFGQQLSIFKKMDHSAYLPLINAAYAIDALCSAAQLQTHLQYSNASYIDAVADSSIDATIRPFLRLSKAIHPCLPREKAVCNSITVGGAYNDAPNVIITGPNAGGKSTLIKAMLINTLLAQTITLTASQRACLTPFYLIKSQINIPDCKGKESLFEAEMYRSKENLDAMARLLPSQTALIVMDEIFNSTNPVEGIAGAYAIAKKLGSYSNASCILTTHYLYLTKLAKQLPTTFSTYKMNVIVDAQGSDIRYPYTLSRGVSRQYIALELLRKNGFDEQLIDEAITIKKRISTPATKQTEHAKQSDASALENKES